jgi:hypothetical protein
MGAGAVVFNPLQDLIAGTLQGHEVANLIRRTAMEQEAMTRAAFEQDRNNQIEDISIQQKLLQAGRPIEGGAVREQGSLGSIAGPIGDKARAAMPTGENQSYEFLRKPDSSRSVKHKTMDGRTLEYELKTPEEQAQEHLKAVLAEKQIAVGGDLSKLRGEQAIKEPGRRADRESRESVARTNRESAERIATGNQAAQTTRTQQQIASREKIAKAKGGKKADELNANQRRIQLKDAEAEQEKLQGQEQNFHKLRGELGDALKTEDGEAYLDPKTGKEVEMNALRRSRLTTEYQTATTQAERLAERQRGIRERFGFGEYADGGKKKPAAADNGGEKYDAKAPAGAPEVGATVKNKKTGKSFKVIGYRNGKPVGEPLD